MSSNKILDDLLLMGFSRELAEEAVEKSGGASVTAAVDYIDSRKTSTEAKVVRIKCDECGRMFKSNDEASFHAYKSDHASFSEVQVEGSDAAAPLTDEELKVRKFELLDKIAKFREKKRMEAERDAIAEEKKRREEGRKSGTIRAEMRDVEMRRAAEDRLKDMKVQKDAKDRILRQIKADRAEMMESRNRGKGAVAMVTETPTPAAAFTTDETHCHIQVRWPDGRCFTHKFNADDRLVNVKEWITNKLMEEDNSAVDINLSSTIPKKRYTESDMDQSLKHLGLCPSTCLFARVMELVQYSR